MLNTWRATQCIAHKMQTKSQQVVSSWQLLSKIRAKFLQGLNLFAQIILTRRGDVKHVACNTMDRT